MTIIGEVEMPDDDDDVYDDEDYEDPTDDALQLYDIPLSGWFKDYSSEGVYYSPLRAGKVKFSVAGNGNEVPTPNEVIKAFGNDKETQCLYPGYLRKYTWEAKGKLLNPPPGLYDYRGGSGSLPCRLVPITVSSDRFIDIGGLYNTIKQDLDVFLNKKSIYEELGLIHKLGVLLYGSAGNSKSTVIRQILRDYEEFNPIVIYVNSRFFSKPFIKGLKETLNNSLKIIVLEELTEYANSREGIATLLEFLDGELSLDNLVTFASTNYPEKLPMNLVNRPSRFDKLYEFENPNPEQRRLLIKHYLDIDASEPEILSTEGLSIAAIKEACLSCKLNNLTLKQTVKVQKDRQKLCEKAFSKTNYGMGF